MRTNTLYRSARWRLPTPSGGRGRVRFFRGRGFTLVEVLLAMVLTVMLMTALMRVASSSMQDRRRLAERRQEAEPVWLDQAARQIEMDLVMADGVSGPVLGETPGSGTRLFILTRSASPEHQTSPHLPVLVSYRLVDSTQGGVLLREERALTTTVGVAGTAMRPSGVQVVAAGIEAVRIGGTTLSLDNNVAGLPPPGSRPASAFTLLVDNRPVAMQAVAPQVPLAVTAWETSGADGDASHATSRTYARTLLTQ